MCGSTRKYFKWTCLWSVSKKMGNFQKQNYACCIQFKYLRVKKKPGLGRWLSAQILTTQACGLGFQSSASMQSTKEKFAANKTDWLQVPEGSQSRWNWELWVQCQILFQKNMVMSNWGRHLPPTSGQDTCMQRWAYPATHALTHKAEQDFTGKPKTAQENLVTDMQRLNAS